MEAIGGTIQPFLSYQESVNGQAVAKGLEKAAVCSDTPNKLRFGRFTYAEKVEYWALVWGTLVMAVTGVMLWAATTVGNLRPRRWLDVATAIHFYEAVLASLAIVVWHFCQVFFDPDAYPMNLAWWDGQVPLEHYQAEHPLDLESVLEAGRSKARDRRGGSKGIEHG